MNRHAPDSALGHRPRPEDRRRGDELLSRLPVDWDVQGGVRSEGFAEDLPDDGRAPTLRLGPAPGVWLWLVPLVALLGAGAQAWLTVA